MRVFPAKCSLQECNIPHSCMFWSNLDNLPLILGSMNLGRKVRGWLSETLSLTISRLVMDISYLLATRKKSVLEIYSST